MDNAPAAGPGGNRTRAGLRALAAAAVLVLGAAACTGERPSPVPRAAPSPAVAVQVEPVARRPVPRTLEPVGTVQAWKRSVVSSRIVATVTAVRVVEGQRVERGDVLITLDDRDIRAQLRRAEAAVRDAHAALDETDRSIAAAARAVDAARSQQELSRTTLERYAALLDRELIAHQEYDEVRARARTATAELARLEETHASLVSRRVSMAAKIEQAEAEAANARVTLAYASVRAPLDGVVVAKTVEVGNLAAPGVALLTLEEERYRLEVAVEESEIPSIRPGQPATVFLDALGVQRAGTVVEIVPAADPSSRTFIVKIEMPPTRGLRSGVYGRAAFTLGERSALLVPKAAVVERGQLETVLVVDPGNVARLRLVKTGKAFGGRVEVLAGVDAGERVIVGPPAAVADGSRVEPAG